MEALKAGAERKLREKLRAEHSSLKQNQRTFSTPSGGAGFAKSRIRCFPRRFPNFTPFGKGQKSNSVESPGHGQAAAPPPTARYYPRLDRQSRLLEAALSRLPGRHAAPDRSRPAYWTRAAAAPPPGVVGETSPAAAPLLLPVPATDLSRPRRHHFNLGTIRLTLLLLVGVPISFRGAQAALALLGSWRVLDLGRPSFASARQWLYRVGLFLLRRALPAVTAARVVIIDHTIQLGTRKCCLVLGLPVTALRRSGYRLTHHDVTVLALEVMTHSSGEKVAAVLQRVQQRVVQIVADHGGDLCNGIQRLQREQPHLVASYDVRHLLAALLKAELREDTAWAQLLAGCRQLLPRVRQTLANILAPPTLRVKARYRNVANHVAWAQQLLALAEREAWDVLGKALALTAAAAQEWFAQHLGWLSELREPLRDFAGLLQVIALAEEQVHEQGLSAATASLFWQRWLTEGGEARWRVWQFAQRVQAALAVEGGQIPAGQTGLGSSLVIESLFGKYKAQAARDPSGEMGLGVLALPVLTSAVDNGLLRDALEAVSWQDVQQWQQEQLGDSAAQRKRQLLAGSTSDPASAAADDGGQNAA